VSLTHTPQCKYTEFLTDILHINTLCPSQTCYKMQTHYVHKRLPWKDTCGPLRICYRNANAWCFLKTGCERTGFIWLKRPSSGRLFWTWLWISGFHKWRRITLLAQRQGLGYWLGGTGFESRQRKYFFVLQNIHIGSRAHPACYSMGIGVFSRG
jgi:hypothetical protein